MLGATDDAQAPTALERQCQSDPWALERIEAFLAAPHEGVAQIGALATLNGRTLGYALLAMAAGICRSKGSASCRLSDASVLEPS